MALTIGVATLAREVGDGLLAVRDHLERVRHAGLLEGAAKQEHIRVIVFRQQDDAACHVLSFSGSNAARRLANRLIRSYPTIGFLAYYVWYPFVRRMRVARPLNYIPYGKEKAIEELARTVGWRAYERKHGESLFTKFFNKDR